MITRNCFTGHKSRVVSHEERHRFGDVVGSFRSARPVNVGHRDVMTTLAKGGRNWCAKTRAGAVTFAIGAPTTLLCISLVRKLDSAGELFELRARSNATSRSSLEATCAN